MTRIAEITERVAKATPGPWTESWDFKPIRRGEARLMAHGCGPQHLGNGARIGDTDIYVPAGEQSDKMYADAALIAHAPSDLAYLLAEVAELKLCLREAHDFILDKCSEHDMAPTIGRIERALTDNQP